MIPAVIFRWMLRSCLGPSADWRTDRDPWNRLLQPPNASVKVNGYLSVSESWLQLAGCKPRSLSRYSKTVSRKALAVGNSPARTRG